MITVVFVIIIEMTAPPTLVASEAQMFKVLEKILT
jgi:hypothetical protein